MADGKVTICTALDNSEVEKDIRAVSGEYGGLKTVMGRMSKMIAGAMEQPVSKACGTIRKELAAAEKQIAQCQKQIQKSESARTPMEEQANQLGAALDSAKAKLAELQAQQAAADKMLSAAGDRALSGPEIGAYMDAVAQKPELDKALVQQQAQVDALQKKWDDCNDKIDEYAYKIDQANREMAVQQTTAEELRRKLDAAEDETKKIRKNAAGGKKELGAMGKAVDSFSSRLKSIALGALLFNGISAGLRELTSYLGQTLKMNEGFTKELAKLKGVLLTAFQPIYNVVTPALTQLMKILTAAAYVVAQFFSRLTGTTVQASADAAKGLYEEVNALKVVEKTAKKAGKTLAGFDEVNVLQQNNQTAGAEAVGGDSKTVAPNFDVSDWGTAELQETAEKIKETLESILVLAGLVGASILTWKIIDAYTAGVSLKGVLTKIGGTLKNVGAMALMIAGAILLIKGYCDGWVNGVGWDDLLLTIGGIALILTGVTIKFGSLGLGIGMVAAGVALLVLGVKDFIENGATLQNTILIIGGAIAVAVGLATAGLSVLVSVIIGAVAAVAAFTAAILLEEPAIMSVEEAQENLNAAKQAAAAAENDYINAVDAAESSLKRLKDAEKAAGVTGEELYKQVQDGTLDYANMTEAQKEVYKAYLDNETKQKELAESTKKLNEAKKAETIASFENQLALAKESGSYDEFKKSVVAAFEAGELSADEARELIGKSMSEMSDDSQKTFMEDLPGDIKNGLDPSQYETTRKKIGDWFKKVGEGFIENIWQPVKDFWNKHIAKYFTAKWWGDLAKGAINGFLKYIFNGLNSLIEKLNSFGFQLPEILGGGRIGFNIKKLAVPQLAKGAVLPANKPFLAMVGDQKHGTNIEAPLSTIQEAVALVMQDQTSAILAGFEASVGVQREILEAVLGIQIGDDVIGNAVARYSRKQAIMRGGAL